MNSKLFTAAGLVLALILFVAANTLGGSLFRSTRLDLTAEKLYTLSDGTKNILRDLPEPVTLRLFFSKKVAKDMTQLIGYAQRVQELIEEYVAHSGGKLKLEVYDPEAYSEEEEKAVAAGLQGVPFNSAGEVGYFGIAGTNTTDESENIAFLQPQRENFLEYDLTRLVYNLAHPKKKVVGLLSKLQMDGDPLARMRNPQADVQSWFILEQIRERFEVRTIPDNVDKIEPGIDVLMVVHPQGLAPQTLFAIDQFVLGGGKAVVCVDPLCNAQEVRSDPNNPLQAMMADKSSDLGPLLGAWGLDFKKDDLAGDNENGLRVRLPQGGEAQYIVWLGMRAAQGTLGKDDSVTAQLDNINFATAGILSRKSDATTTVTPLVETSKNSMRVTKSAIQFGDDPQKLIESFVSGGEKLMIAARVSGPAKSAYPDGKPKAETPADGAKPEEKSDEAGTLKESKGPINVIVVADADFLHDRWWTRSQNFFGQRIATPTADNNGFVLNALENMSGNNDLISLRGRGNSVRPFDRVNEIRRESDKRFLAKEKELDDKLKDLKSKLSDLGKGGKDGAEAPILSEQLRKDKQEYENQVVVTVRDLRRVKHERNQEIEALGTRLKLIDTFAVPLLVILAAIGVAALRPKPKGG